MGKPSLGTRRIRRVPPGLVGGEKVGLAERGRALAAAASTGSGRPGPTPRPPRSRQPRPCGYSSALAAASAAPGQAARLLALRPVELLVDLLLGIAALEERRLGRQDHVGVAADVGDRVRRRQPHLVQHVAEDRLHAPRAAGPAGVARIGRPRRRSGRSGRGTGRSSPTPRPWPGTPAPTHARPRSGRPPSAAARR